MASSHGTGRFHPTELGSMGEGCVLEEGVLVWHPQTVHLGADVYLGHRSMLKGDTRGTLVVGDGTWIGQDCYFHSAGSITVGAGVGIGPRVMILTSTHEPTAPPTPIIAGALELAPVSVGDGCDIGIGAIILPGTSIGAGVQIGAGAVVSKDVPDGAIAAGVPARVIGHRGA